METSELMLDTRGDEWTVFRAGFDCAATIFATLWTGVVGCALWAGAGTSFAGIDHGFWGTVPGALVLLVLGALLFGVGYLGGLAYYLALDERHITVGRARRSSDETVDRGAVASVMWQRRVQHPHAVLCAADGSALLHVGWEMSRTRMGRVAQHLGVPFVPAPE